MYFILGHGRRLVMGIIELTFPSAFVFMRELENNAFISANMTIIESSWRIQWAANRPQH
jgi:hypothetical protein